MAVGAKLPTRFPLSVPSLESRAAYATVLAPDSDVEDMDSNDKTVSDLVTRQGSARHVPTHAMADDI